MLEAHAVVVGNERTIKGAAVEWRGQDWRAIDGFMIALAERKEEFIPIRETVIDAHRPGGVQDRIDSRKSEVIDEQILICRSGFRGQRQDVLGHRTNRNLIVGERLTTLHSANRLRRGGVENLPHENWIVVITRIGANLCRRQESRKIPLPLHVGRDRAEVGRTLLLPELLPREKEKRLVMTVVNLGNPDRPTEGSAIVMFFIDVFGLLVEILKPLLCVQGLIAENFEG